MCEPVMVLSSTIVYENTTIIKWMESGRDYDPITGIPMQVGKLPRLLMPRNDRKQKATDFIEKHASFAKAVFNPETDKDKIDWETLFTVCEAKIKNINQGIIDNQKNLRFESKQLFRPLIMNNDIGSDGDKKEIEEKLNDDEIRVAFDEQFVLDPAIPVVCFMGPSREGKSTIINDILGYDACKTSTKSNIALTKGAWITLYQGNIDHRGVVTGANDALDEPQLQTEGEPEDLNLERKEDDGNTAMIEFYLLDMEGLSHQVTKFTEKLFYACYATANLVVWSDKKVGSDRFQMLMNTLKTNMAQVAVSAQKPSFLYLKRDAGDCDFDPYDDFTQYINKDESFEWFRKMNIFASLNGYELDRPKRIKGKAMSFRNSNQVESLLLPLIKKISNLIKNSQRFCPNIIALKHQIKFVNSKTALSMTKKLVSENAILRLFLIEQSNEHFRRRDMIYVAIHFNWDHNLLEKCFNDELNKLRYNPSDDKTKLKSGSSMYTKQEKIQRKGNECTFYVSGIDETIMKRLISTKNEIYQRIKNKQDVKAYGAKMAKYGSATMASLNFVTWTLLAGPGAGLFFAVVGGSLGAAGGGIVGKSVEVSEKAVCWYKGDTYIRYALGRTDDEIELDKKKAKQKTLFSEYDWENDDDNWWDYY